MIDPRAFVRFAAGTEIVVAAAAMLLGGLMDVSKPDMIPTARAVGVGLAATVPMLAFYLVTLRLPLPGFRRIHALLRETLGPPLAACRWWDLALLAALAGVCEELLFRGVLQPLLGRVDATGGVLGANLLFGLAHAVTPTYGVAAFVIGCYLSGIQSLAGGNLIAAMLAHGLYDFVAFLLIARDYRNGSPVDQEVDGDLNRP